MVLCLLGTMGYCHARSSCEGELELGKMLSHVQYREGRSLLQEGENFPLNIYILFNTQQDSPGFIYVFGEQNSSSSVF